MRCVLRKRAMLGWYFGKLIRVVLCIGRAVVSRGKSLSSLGRLGLILSLMFFSSIGPCTARALRFRRGVLDDTDHPENSFY